MSVILSRRLATGRRQAAPLLLLSALFLAVVITAALVPTLFSGYDPLATEISSALQPPSLEHPFGTDQSGRDVLSRVIHGARYSLVVGFGASLAALLAGLVIGVASGLSPRPVDAVLSRIVSIGMAFPEFLLALLVIAIIGPGETSLVVAIAVAATPAYARLARSQTLVVRSSSYVGAAASLGVHPAVTVLRHVIPNTLGPLVVLATIGVGTAIVSGAGLSFLGLGPQPPTPEWGVILSDGRNFLSTAWWIALFPGLVITATVVSVSVIGRHLQARGEGRRS